jgi:uncharacterized protein with PIN domain
MSLVCFRFYEELNDFLPAAKKQQSFSCSFKGNPSVKDVIESLGVPHVEVDLILVNGKSVDFRYRLSENDHVSVYPVFESLDISSVTHLREKPLRILKFILDVHLGKLARYLRLCGFDTLYDRNYTDRQIIQISASQKRIILTHDKGILKNKLITRGYWIRSQNPDEQLKEVVIRFDLKSNSRAFTRCIVCNGILADVSKEEIKNRLLPKTNRYYKNFKKCPDCDGLYWEGSHYENMKKYIKRMLDL